jgi:hypothetical protein
MEGIDCTRPAGGCAGPFIGPEAGTCAGPPCLAPGLGPAGYFGGGPSGPDGASKVNSSPECSLISTPSKSFRPNSSSASTCTESADCCDSILDGRSALIGVTPSSLFTTSFSVFTGGRAKSGCLCH